MIRVTLGDLARLPVERLARLLMEVAAEDRTLLARLEATIQESGDPQGSPPLGNPPLGTPVSDGDGGKNRSPASDRFEIIGQSPAMRHILELIERFARTDEPILITGESGTGKELAARAIHARSRRHSGPFVAINCAAIPATLVASELFGHEKGAFTGAAARSKGQIEHANGGTLFLDEIGDMPVDLQAHLLRFLQERKIVRVGGRETIDVDARIVSATNVRVTEAIGDGRFREDLYYRLNTLSVELPPLRERPEDIAYLADHFLTQAAAQFGRDITGFAPEAMAVLLRHGWPGNVRELMAVVRRAAIVGDGQVIMPTDLIGMREPPARAVPVQPAPVQPVPANRPIPGSAEEREALLSALNGTAENITLTAQELGVSRVTLYRMLRRHGIALTRGLKTPPITG
jgi:transcriptional regulator with PAS, ATPase and Fis domain